MFPANSHLDKSVFESVADAQRQLDAWRFVYNEVRLHQSLGGLILHLYLQKCPPPPSSTEED